MASERDDDAGFDEGDLSLSHGMHCSFFQIRRVAVAGGRYFTTLVMVTSSRLRWIDRRSSSRNLPAAPTNGRPVLSSCSPGASLHKHDGGGRSSFAKYRFCLFRKSGVSPGAAAARPGGAWRSSPAACHGPGTTGSNPPRPVFPCASATPRRAPPGRR